MKRILFFIALLPLSLLAQVQDTSLAYDYPYKLPIWGQKAADRGIKLQLPYGFNTNYVFNQMELEISEFGLSFGNDPSSPANQLIQKYVNLETLNFKKTEARTNGMNLRADVWVLPFLNVYGIYSNSTGGTSVSLQPTWYDESGNLVLSLPQFTADVEFNANTFGFGTTLAYGFLDYFTAVDVNYTQSYSELLDDPAQFLVASARIGQRITLKNDWKLAVYVGGMWRGFVEQNGNLGSVVFEEVFPEIGSKIFPAIDTRIEANNEAIAGLDPNKPLDYAQIQVLEKKNEVLYNVESAFEQAFATDINYNIKKDIVNNWSVQFGFNLEMSDNWTFRSEFGKGTGNTFVLTGIQYRFGL